MNSVSCLGIVNNLCRYNLSNRFDFSVAPLIGRPCEMCAHIYSDTSYENARSIAISDSCYKRPYKTSFGV